MAAKKSALLLLSSVTIALAWFGPNVRIDHQYLPKNICVEPAIAVGPGAPSIQPLYVTFEVDTLPGGRCDIWFQKSTDAGRTWLPADLLIRRGDRYAFYPDITTDPDGNVYIVYTDEYIDTVGARIYQIACVRSSDGGTTWAQPARVDDSPNRRAMGWARIAADTVGNLFCAWVDWRTGISHIWSSVSTDRGATWRQNVQVDDDTLTDESYHPEVFVQPGTNHYLVAATTYRWIEGHIRPCAFLCRSTDRGLTFQPGVHLDTFNWAAGTPHVVADRDHVICDYFGESRSARGRMLVEARTFYTQPDTWGTPYPVANLDSLHHPYYSGALALSGDGRVHTALMVCDAAEVEWLYYVYYTSSADHGVSWSGLELVDEDTTLSSGHPDIGADSAGHAYVVWPHGDDGQFRIWFATNNPLAIAEEPGEPAITEQPSATVVRGVLFLPKMGIVPEGTVPIFGPSLLDASGRKVMDLRPGANDVRTLAPGVYFVRSGPSAVSWQPSAVTKVVIAD